jgi:hypothetical protein
MIQQKKRNTKTNIHRITGVWGVKPTKYFKMNSVSFRPSLADLKLQMTLYYNSIYSVMFMFVVGACSIQKVITLFFLLLK